MRIPAAVGVVGGQSLASLARTARASGVSTTTIGFDEEVLTATDPRGRDPHRRRAREIVAGATPPAGSPVKPSRVSISARVCHVFEQSLREAVSRGSESLAPEHLLLAPDAADEPGISA